MNLIPIEDGGFRHGVGVFETVRVEKGKARWREWHEESIREGAKVLGLEVEVANLRKVPEGNGLLVEIVVTIVPSNETELLKLFFTPNNQSVRLM